jgi:hypothetical protein
VAIDFSETSNTYWPPLYDATFQKALYVYTPPCAVLISYPETYLNWFLRRWHSRLWERCRWLLKFFRMQYHVDL